MRYITINGRQIDAINRVIVTHKIGANIVVVAVAGDGSFWPRAEVGLGHDVEGNSTTAYERIADVI